MVARVETLFPERCATSEFVDSMSRAVSGVSIVTTDGPHGRYGLTVGSMTSLSAKPPMLLICVNRSAIAHDAIRDNERFVVNVLASSQQQHADRFAGRSEDAYAFDREAWETATRVPRLREAAAWFECRLVSAMTFGSHSIFVGEVCDASPGDATPLLYTGRNYGRPIFLN